MQHLHVFQILHLGAPAINKAVFRKRDELVLALRGKPCKQVVVFLVIATGVVISLLCLLF